MSCGRRCASTHAHLFIGAQLLVALPELLLCNLYAVRTQVAHVPQPTCEAPAGVVHCTSPCSTVAMQAWLRQQLQFLIFKQSVLSHIKHPSEQVQASKLPPQHLTHLLLTQCSPSPTVLEARCLGSTAAMEGQRPRTCPDCHATQPLTHLLLLLSTHVPGFAASAAHRLLWGAGESTSNGGTACRK